jgi:hypothetical protein
MEVTLSFSQAAEAFARAITSAREALHGEGIPDTGPIENLAATLGGLAQQLPVPERGTAKVMLETLLLDVEQLIAAISQRRCELEESLKTVTTNAEAAKAYTHAARKP